MAPHRGVALVLIDGLGDVSIPELGNRTPLEAAHTPFLDALAGQHEHQTWPTRTIHT